MKFKVIDFFWVGHQTRNLTEFYLINIFFFIFIYPSLCTELTKAASAIRCSCLNYLLFGLIFILLSSHAELAQAVVDAGAVPLLVLCIQEPELSLKRIAASALSDICKHSPELAQTVVDAGAIAHLAQMILNPDAKLKVG